MIEIVLAQKIEICDLHLFRMNQALDHIKHLYPFSKEIFPLKKYEDLTSLEMFTSRFSKLQDYMGEFLFPAYLKFLGENVDHLSMIDLLNKLEKYEILESVKKWKYLRNLRNNLAHEYPNYFEIIATTLKEAFEHCNYLEQTLNQIKDDYAARSLGEQKIDIVVRDPNQELLIYKIAKNEGVKIV
jgi:uncharacterized protein with HEPN domain